VTENSTPARRAARTVLIAGLAAGVLDIAWVMIYYGVAKGVSPVRILQSVAVGLYGPASYRGGGETAAWGFVCHFVIALGAAAVFYAASRRFAFLVRHAIASGLLYGVAVYLFMSLVVLPLSAVPPGPFPPANWPVILPAHLLCVGLPIALLVRRGSK